MVIHQQLIKPNGYLNPRYSSYAWKKCRVCKRLFPYRPKEKLKKNSRTTDLNLRPYYACTCSKKCSHIYNYEIKPKEWNKTHKRKK